MTKRHRWTENPTDENPAQFVDTYKVSKCQKCGLVRLHKYIGGSYLKTYLSKGTESSSLPLCGTS